MVDREPIGVPDLRLDAINPRHAKVGNDREAIRALIEDDAPKLVRLAQSIAAHGLNPTDVFLVLREPGPIYTVLEGNRRLAALKLLANPDIADEERHRKRFREAARGMPPISEVMCAVVHSRDEAYYWQELRHTGQREGVGVVGWNAEAVARFNSRPRSRDARALAFVDDVARAYKSNTALQKALAQLRSTRFTNLVRFIDDPDVRKRLGFDYIDGNAVWHFDAEALAPALDRIIADLAGPVGVGSIFNKPLRAEYLRRIAGDLPAPSSRRPDAFPLQPPPRTTAAAKKKQEATPPPARLFEGLQLTALGQRVTDILDELKRIEVQEFPNSAAVLVRVVIELSTTELMRLRGWPEGTLPKNVRRALTAVDPAGNGPEFEPIRRGLSDGSSMWAVQTMHKYVHNPHFHPVAAELRAIAANWTPFLAAVNQIAMAKTS